LTFMCRKRLPCSLNFQVKTSNPLASMAPKYLLWCGFCTFGFARILYNEKVQFQDCNSVDLASFNTFTFFVSISNNKSISGDGFASLLWLTILIPLNLMMELMVLVVHQLAF
jgi:hypothetical protein